jgi:hypothetical protein
MTVDGPWGYGMQDILGLAEAEMEELKTLKGIGEEAQPEV